MDVGGACKLLGRLSISDPSNMEARRHPFIGTLSIDRNMRRFVLQGRSTGRVLGTGSYGTVEEVWT
jgi:hypothetical protein